MRLAVLVPVFNEQESMNHTLRTLEDVLQRCIGDDHEIVVINDGSTDGTAQILRDLQLPHVQVITHPVNRGYSASLKTGIRHSTGQWIGITDSDGTYPVEQFPTLLSTMEQTKADMTVGARVNKERHIPLLRRPAKAVINNLARLLTGMRIPDLNSGMRIFTRELAERFMHLYPQRFSFTITITLAALTNDYHVEYVPIDYHKRTGKSSLSSGFNGVKNFGQFLSLIVRMITYFRPLRFFIWPTLLLIGAGLALAIYTLWTAQNISDSGVLLIVSGLQVGLFGLLAEAVVRNRK